MVVTEGYPPGTGGNSHGSGTIVCPHLTRNTICWALRKRNQPTSQQFSLICCLSGVSQINLFLT